MKRLLETAMAKMVHRQPFYASICLQLPILEDKTIPTAATDGKRVFYNPEYMAGLTDEERIGVMGHEALHVAHLHAFRKQGRHHYLWNIACDFVINRQLIESRFKLPKGCLLSQEFDGKSEEQVYAILEKQLKDKRKSDGDGGKDGKDGPLGPMWDEVREPEGDQSKRQAEENEVKGIVMSAVKQANAMGRLPAAFEGWIERFMNPKLPWDALLREFFTSLSRADYSWLRPNRRYVASGVCLPSLRSNTLGEGVLAQDTSGSVDNDDVEQFFGEIDHIWAVLKPERVLLAQCDCEVSEWRTYEAGEKIEHKRTSSGGTDFRPVFERIEAEGMSPAFLVYFTDGYGTFPDREPSYPVLWVMTTDVQPPWGRVVSV